MDKSAYRDEIKLRLTGGLLELEIDDSTLDKVIDAALREIQRYICSTKIVTTPYSKCIDVSKIKDSNGKKIKVSSILRIFRTNGYLDTSPNNTGGMIDPMYVSQWQLLSGTGNLYNFQDYMSNYMSWNTLLQIRNTTSTDLAFRYDKASNKLYINIVSDIPKNITLEYVPRYDNVEEITSDYWIDMLMKMCVALTKVTLGRIRTRYTQSNALWVQDGQQILEEGNTELNELRRHLVTNMNLFLPID